MAERDQPLGVTRNLVSYWLAFAFAAIIGFFLSPYVVKHLGSSAYGVWTLLGTLVGYLGLLDFGIRGAVTRYVARFHAAQDAASSSSIVSAALAMFGLLGVVSIALATALAYLSPLLFNIPESLIPDSRLILFIGGITVAVTLIGAVFGGVLTGLQRFDVTSALEIVLTALRTVAIVLAIETGFGLVALALIYLASSCASGFITWIAATRLYPDLQIRFDKTLSPQLRTIFFFGIALSAIHALDVLISYTDIVVVATFLPVSAVTYYAIAGNLCNYARQATSAVSVLMTPRVSAMMSSGSDKIVDEVLAAARISTLIAAPIAFTLFFRGESFINLWMGTEYGAISADVLKILAVVVLLGGAQNVGTASMIGANRHRLLIPIFALEAFFNLVLSIAFVQAFGLAGVALGTLIPSLIVSFWFMPRCLHSAIGLPKNLYLLKGWLLPVFACIPFGIVSILTEHFLMANNLPTFFIQVTLTLPLVILCALLMCLNCFERRRVFSMVKRFVSLGTRR